MGSTETIYQKGNWGTQKISTSLMLTLHISNMARMQPAYSPFWVSLLHPLPHSWNQGGSLIIHLHKQLSDPQGSCPPRCSIVWAFLAGRQVWRPPQGPEKTFPPLERYKEEEHWYQQAPLCQATSLHMNTNLAEFSSDLRFIILVDKSWVFFSGRWKCTRLLSSEILRKYPVERTGQDE